MTNKNLKGTLHRLLYYRYRPTGNEFPKVRMVKGIEQPYMERELEKIYITEDEVRNFTLDKHGQPLPYVDGHITIISNYIFDYWSHFISAEGVALYGHLKRYCYGDKDYCWPDISLISLKMNKSRNTIKKILHTLEEYGFVLMFNVQNGDRNNMDESPLFKVRKQVSFLPHELYEQLPIDLKLDHDKYMESIVSKYNQDLELDAAVNFTDIYNTIIDNGTVVRKERPVAILNKEAESKRLLLKNEQTEKDIERWSIILEDLKSKLSAPSYNTWLASTFAIKRKYTITVYAPHPFIKDWIESQYKSLIEKAIRSEDELVDDIKFESIQPTQ